MTASTFNSRQRRKSDNTAAEQKAALAEENGLMEDNPIIAELIALTDKVEQLTLRPLKWTTEIRDLGIEQLRLNQPILITIEEYTAEDSVIARYPEVEAFGEGQTEPEAILQLKADIVRLYYDLTGSSPETLGVLPQSWLRVLRQVISEEKA
jgi:hypothetical protein